MNRRSHYAACVYCLRFAHTQMSLSLEFLGVFQDTKLISGAGPRKSTSGRGGNSPSRPRLGPKTFFFCTVSSECHIHAWDIDPSNMQSNDKRCASLVRACMKKYARACVEILYERIVKCNFSFFFAVSFA